MTYKEMRKEKDIRFFVDTVETLAKEVNIEAMNEYTQHGNTACLTHCLAVAYLSYSFARKLKLKVDYTSLIRGAVLHDYFLYDWHDTNTRFTHGFTHPQTAYEKASLEVALNSIEENIIKRHMFPLTLIPPKTKEAAVVCLLDKYCAIAELTSQEYYVRVLPQIHFAS